STPPHSTRFYTLSLHDALPISSWRHKSPAGRRRANRVSHRRHQALRLIALSCRSSTSHDYARIALSRVVTGRNAAVPGSGTLDVDRKSTRLNSSHVKISYAVFC